MRDEHDTDDLAGLEALRDVPAPRRTDAAFSKSVADDVARARSPRWLFLPALAAGAAAIGFFLATPSGPEELARVIDAGQRAPTPPVVALDGPASPVETAATVDLEEADPGLFSFPALDASSEQELLAFERRLDEAMKKQQPL